MSLHRLSAGRGYQYLTRNTACGDLARGPREPLTAYYTESGYPVGRWLGAGLTGLASDDATAIRVGDAVTEEQMANLFGQGQHPVSGEALGRRQPHPRTLEERVQDRVVALSPTLTDHERAAAVSQIKAAEEARPPGVAVSGFDLTFTVPKSASVLWAIGDPQIQAAVWQAHAAAVADMLALIEERALFTRTGALGVAQVPTRGMIAAGFDHWDTRTGDPNLHTHVVVSNRVQGLDGKWRTLDSRALHQAAVAMSEIYDDVFADHLATRLPVEWGWRSRGQNRTPAHEITGIDDTLLHAFSTRSASISGELARLTAAFQADHGRRPSRTETVKLRQQATLSTRPPKTPHPLPVLLARWADTASRVTGMPADQVIRGVLTGRPARALRAEQLSPGTINKLAEQVCGGLVARRSTFNEWNMLAETARVTRGIRTPNREERTKLLDRVTSAVKAQCVPLDAPQVIAVPEQLRRPDGASVFTRAGEAKYSHPALLAAEEHLLEAHAELTQVRLEPVLVAEVLSPPTASHAPKPPQRVSPDQAAAITEVATSGRRVDVLVGPAGSGKTTTLLGLRTAWEARFGPGSVIGLAPSANASHELGHALGIPTENTSKWLHETVGQGAITRTEDLQLLAAHRAAAITAEDLMTARRIDAATANLTRQQEQWQLRAGQLLIIDEATLAGTIELSQLVTQAEQAEAKVLLVGDHAQLGAVTAGGGFGLLARTGQPAQLHSLWRFTNRWEAHATRGLRAGDPAVIDTYQAYDRLQAGTAEVMIDLAYSAWATDRATGTTSLLIAPDNTTVQALNDRAHLDLIAAGTVHGPQLTLGGTCNPERGEVGAGDTIITRRNSRALKLPGHGHVSNGQLWTVQEVNPDGSLTVQPAAARPRQALGGPGAIRLPAEYVAEHVELGYAATAHRAQGVTVSTSHVIAHPDTSREAFYVAMTRGRASNTAYLITDPTDPDCTPTTPAPPALTAAQAVARILANSQAELSATETIATNTARACSLANLSPVRATIAAMIDAERWPQLLLSAGLPQTLVEQMRRSPAAGQLHQALRRGEDLGHNMPAKTIELIGQHHAETNDPAQDLSRALGLWLATAPDLTAVPPGDPARTLGVLDRVPPTGHELGQALTEVDRLIDARIAALAAAAAGDQPANSWLRPASVTTPDAVPLRSHELAVILARADLTDDTRTVPDNTRAARNQTKQAELALRRLRNQEARTIA